MLHPAPVLLVRGAMLLAVRFDLVSEPMPLIGPILPQPPPAP